MPITIPKSVQQALGEEAASDFTEWFETILAERTVRRDEYREVLSCLDVLEHDVAEIKTAIGDLHRTMDERFDRVNERFARMNERFDQMYERIMVMTRWTVGTVALLGTIMTIILAISQFARP